MYHCPLALTRRYEKLEIDIFARIETGEPHEVRLGDRVRLLRLPCGDPDIHLRKEKLWFAPMCEFIWEIDVYARSQDLRYDVLHGHYADGMFVAFQLSRLWRVPYCVTPHSLGRRKKQNSIAINEGTEDELEERYTFGVRVDRETKSLTNARAICCNSREEVDYILRNYTSTIHKQFQIVPNGVLRPPRPSKNQIEAVKVKLRLKNNELVVLQVGRVDYRKGQRELIAAAPAVIDQLLVRNNTRVKFVFIGWEDNFLGRQLTKTVHDRGIQDHFVFMGPVNHGDMNIYYHTADAYAHTAPYDVFPLTVLEAMASGLPTMISRNCGISGMIEDGYDGLIVNPLEIGEVEAKLIELLSSRSVAKKMGEAATRKVVQRLSWDRIAEQLGDIYEAIGTQKSSREI